MTLRHVVDTIPAPAVVNRSTWAVRIEQMVDEIPGQWLDATAEWGLPYTGGGPLDRAKRMARRDFPTWFLERAHRSGRLYLRMLPPDWEGE